MKHTFAIPAYKDSAFLRECIESLLAQTVPSEVTLCTSTPSPFIERVAADYRLPLRVNAAPPGIASDWNFALTATDGDLVTIAHQDDLYAPAYGQRIREAFTLHRDVMLAFTDYTEHTPHGPRAANVNVLIKRCLTWLAFRSDPALDSPTRKRVLLRLGNPVCCPSVAINRRLRPEFRFGNDFQSNLDWDAWSRLADAPGTFVYLREPLVSHRVHEATETSACIADRRREREDLQMFRRFWGEVPARLIHTVYRLSYRANRV